MKIVKWVVLGLLVVIIGVVLIVYFNLNGIVRKTVQSQSSAQLNVPTSLEGAAVSLFGGSLSLDDFQVSSPPGFSAPKILTFDDASLKVSWGQLRQDPVHVQTINIEQPKLVIEQAGGKFNFQALMDLTKKTPDTTTTEQGPSKKVIIDKLTITQASVVVRPGIPGLAQEIHIPIPDVDVEKIGTGEGNQNGAALKEVVMEIVTVMAAKAAESDKLPPEVRAILSGNLQDLAANVKNEAVKRITAEVQKKLPPEAAKALEGVIKDPQSITTNPTKALEGVIKVPQGATNPSSGAGGAVEGLGGLLNRQKQKKPVTTQPSR
jgi:hypothetical protein